MLRSLYTPQTVRVAATAVAISKVRLAIVISPRCHSLSGARVRNEVAESCGKLGTAEESWPASEQTLATWRSQGCSKQFTAAPSGAAGRAADVLAVLVA